MGVILALVLGAAACTGGDPAAPGSEATGGTATTMGAGPGPVADGADLGASEADPTVTPPTDAVVEAMVRDLVDSGHVGGDGGLSEIQARCLAVRLVDGVGLDALARAGRRLGPSSSVDVAVLDGTERERFADAFVACFDIGAVVRTELQRLEGLAPLTTGQLTCVVTELTSDGSVTALVRDAVLEAVALPVEGSALSGPMARAFERCSVALDPPVPAAPTTGG